MSIPAIAVLAADGSLSHLTHPHPQVATTIATPLKSQGHTVSLSPGTQIVTLSPGSAGAAGYTIVQPQQLQTISIDGQEAIYALANGQQAIQIGNQLISPGNIVARGAATATSQSQQQHQVLSGNAVQFAQIGGPGGQTVAVRQAGGNVLQAIQMPMQQSIPIQIPISTANGTMYQTIHLPLQTLQAISAGNVTAQVVPQMSQVQVGSHQIQVTQQPQQQQQQQQSGPNVSQVKQEPGLESSQSTAQTTTTSSANSNAGQHVVANVQLPNGQIGQIVQTMMHQPQQIAWSGNTINLGNLTGECQRSCCLLLLTSCVPQFRDCSSNKSSLRVRVHCRV